MSPHWGRRYICQELPLQIRPLVRRQGNERTSSRAPITIIEPENLETIFITGGLVEAIDKQTVRIVAWIDQPSTHSRKIVCRLAAPLDVAMAMNVQMQEAFAKLLSELEQQNAIEKAYED